jgi:hypothetical protein
MDRMSPEKLRRCTRCEKAGRAVKYRAQRNTHYVIEPLQKSARISCNHTFLLSLFKEQWNILHTIWHLNIDVYMPKCRQQRCCMWGQNVARPG